MEPAALSLRFFPPSALSRWRASPCTSAGASASLRARIADANRTDPLTGLLNRRAFEELLELELERARAPAARCP